jgi:hypothetical protein
MANLTPEQRQLLDYTAECDQRWRDAKLNAKRRAEELVQKEIAAFAAARDKAVYDSVAAGIPKRQVGIYGLRTTSPNTVHEAYSRVAQQVEHTGISLAAKPTQRFTITTYEHPMAKAVYLVTDSENYHQVYLSTVGLTGTADGWVFVDMGDDWLPALCPDDMPGETWDYWIDNRPV